MNREDSKRFHLLHARAFYALITRTAGRKWALRLQLLFQKKMTGFDAAISFLHNGAPHVYYGGCNEFVLRCVEADTRVAFLHCDYGRIQGSCPDNTRGYEQFDTIAACSAGCREAFLRLVPQLRDKTAVVHNCQNFAAVRAMAQRGSVSLPQDRLNVVSVARFGKEKGLLRCIQAISTLQAEKEKFRLYLIGDGVEYRQAEGMIEALGLQDRVFLMGEMENPYGYMQAADLLLIPSYSEAAPMVIGEAACLGTPILSTRTSSAEEMIEKTGYGWVCDNSREGIAEGLRTLWVSPCKLTECRERLRTMCFSNQAAVSEFTAAIHKKRTIE